ncbi:MAG: hypothetical protein JW934_14540 [Anaerolineae bacterium]|nr:hypothetical protein [Anaerolineae bacterium]
MSIHSSLFLISAAALAFQITLTRLFALAQGSHMAFMAVSLALLGGGASGTWLSLRRPRPDRLPHLLAVAAMLFAVAVLASYLAINYLPFDAYRLAWERIQILWLISYYLALTIPFFFSGLAVGAALASRPAQAGSWYAANLLGAAAGSPLALLALATVGGPGNVFLCALFGWLAALAPQPSLKRLIPLGLVAVALGYFTLNPPPLFDVRLTPYKALSQAQLYPGSEVIISRWNAFSRVDVIRSDGIRSAPGLSFAYSGPLPSQLGLTVDGDNLTPITAPGDPDFTAHLPLSLAFVLRPDADILILEPGGGLSVLTALQQGARSVTVVQSNPAVAQIVRNDLSDLAGHLYDDPRVRLIIDEPRSFLRRASGCFDLILLPLTGSFHSVTTGAFALNEEYRYTVEAFADALARLTPSGLLIAERWLQLPPSESLRLWAVAVTASRRAAVTLGDANLFAVQSLQTSLVGVAAAPLSGQDLRLIRDFAAAQQIDLIWLPDIWPEEANRYSVVPDAAYYRTFDALVTADNPARFYADYPFAVAPSTDDHPYFFHFFKWRQIPEVLQSLGKTWQPFGGSGYLVLLVLLVLSILLSVGFILLPLLRRRAVRHGSVPFLLYFSLLGLGFLFVEIPLLQRFILYLGQPAYAFAVVVSTLLLCAGLGSRYLSKRLSLQCALVLIALLTLTYPHLLPVLFRVSLSLPWAGRATVAVLVLSPLGLLMGIPFPTGLRRVDQVAPHLIPWVWAVNGCASVISAVLAALVALTWGFSAVLWGAAAAYALAGAVSWQWRPG